MAENLEIHKAIQKNHLRKIKLVLSKDKDLINVQDENGNTALHLAILGLFFVNRNTNLIKQRIFEYIFTFPGLKVDIKNRWGHIPLSLSVFKGDLLLFYRLQQHTPVDLLEQIDGEGKNLLHHATERGFLDIIQAICINAQKTLNKRDLQGFTPFHYIGYSIKHDNVLHTLQYLLYQAPVDIHLEYNQLTAFFQVERLEPNLSPVVVLVLEYYRQKKLPLPADIVQPYLHLLLKSYQFCEENENNFSFDSYFNENQQAIIFKIIASLLHTAFCCSNISSLRVDSIPLKSLMQLKNKLKIYFQKHIYREKIYTLIEERFECSNPLVSYLWYHWSSQKDYKTGNQYRTLIYQHLLNSRTKEEGETTQFYHLPTEIKFLILEYIIPEVIESTARYSFKPYTFKLQKAAFYSLTKGVGAFLLQNDYVSPREAIEKRDLEKRTSVEVARILNTFFPETDTTNKIFQVKMM